MAQWTKLASLCPIKDAALNTRNKLLTKALEFIDRAALDKPDLMVLPELFLKPPGRPDRDRDLAEPVEGPTLKAIAKKAKEHSTYIFAPLLERDGDRLYNATALIDRRGKLQGVYRKNHPVICEIRAGISPGTDVPVFETDFGRVGACICYDVNFPDIPARLHQGGAQLVVFPSAFRAGLILQSHAFFYQFWVLSSCPNELGLLIDPLGRILRRAWANSYNPPHGLILSHRVNLDCILLHCDYNEIMLKRIKEKYGPGVEIDAEEPERRFLLTSHLPDKSALGIKKEFKLESLDDFWIRANQYRAWGLANLPRKKSAKAVKMPPTLPDGWRENDL